MSNQSHDLYDTILRELPKDGAISDPGEYHLVDLQYLKSCGYLELTETATGSIYAIAFVKLETDGYIYVVETIHNPNHKTLRQYISFNGLFALENCPRFYKNRPYKWAKVKNRCGMVWKVVTTVAIIINALAILVFTYLTYIKN